MLGRLHKMKSTRVEYNSLCGGGSANGFTSKYNAEMNSIMVFKSWAKLIAEGWLAHV
jgi:hypothetical protein